MIHCIVYRIIFQLIMELVLSLVFCQSHAQFIVRKSDCNGSNFNEHASGRSIFTVKLALLYGILVKRI